jgi:hypothetical protein
MCPHARKATRSDARSPLARRTLQYLFCKGRLCTFNIHEEVVMTNHDDIERRAYELYEATRREDGRDWDDWLKAERELRDAESSAERLVEATESRAEPQRCRRADQRVAAV